MFEGIAQRDPVVGHDHSMGTGIQGFNLFLSLIEINWVSLKPLQKVVFDPKRVLKRYTSDELRALLEAGKVVNEMKDINDPDDKCDDPPCMSWEI